MSLFHINKELFKSAIENRFINSFEYNTFENVIKVGTGGFGEVKRAYLNTLRRYVALKCLNDDNDEFYGQFLDELQNISAVNHHDNIIHFYGVSIDPSIEKYYLVLQYAEDGNLQTYLRNNFEKLDWNAKVSMAKDIARGLSHIHQKNIVHRDLHSKNILVHEGKLLISDLGLSKQLDSKSNFSIEGGVIAYTDPLYLRNAKTYKRNKTSDIYSLGVLLWELSSGRPPFYNCSSMSILQIVASGKREQHIRGTPIDYIYIYSNAWKSNPKVRSTIEKICDSLENIKLENVYNISSENIQLENNESIQLGNENISMGTFSKDTVSSDQLSLSKWWKSEGFRDETSKILQDDSVHDASILNMQSAKSALAVLGAVGDAVQPYLPLFSTVTIIISEINNIYANAKYNKKICNSLMDRVNAAEFSIKNLERRKNENKKNFRDPHSKNILVHEGKLLISDLGLSKQLDSKSNFSIEGGVIAYTDPLYLRNAKTYKRNKTSDIYSLGVLLWELSSGRPPFYNCSSMSILQIVASGKREQHIRGTPIDYIYIYSNAWKSNPKVRSTIEKICDSLENIKLENVYNISSENIQLENNESIQLGNENISMGTFSKDTVSSDQLSLSKWWKSEGFRDETSKILQDDSVHDASILNMQSAKSALAVLGAVGDAVQPYLPLFSTVTIIISEINNIYANAKYNKKICNSLMDRVNAAEFSIKNLERRKNENKKNFRDPVYFRAFHHFIEVMKNIKQFIANVSTLSGFQKYFHASSVIEKFESLTSEFESAMNDLHFVTSLRNEEQRRIDHESLNLDLQEMAKFLNTIGENVIDANQQLNTVITEIVILKNQMESSKPNTTPITANEIDPKDLKNPLVGRHGDQRGLSVVRKMLSNGEDVACKTIRQRYLFGALDQKTQAHLSILGKLKESKNILKFYGLSKVKDLNIMVLVFEWADFGSLQEVYREYDIGWRSKVQMALEICRGLVFLQTCGILHREIRCANIMMTKQLVPKLSNFKYARRNNEAIPDSIEVANIWRWTAPEKMKGPKKVRCTFKCEIFSFGMLLWELLFQKIPYENKGMLQIRDHVLKGGREKIIMNCSSQENKTIQNTFVEIIISAWQQDVDIRASLLDIFLKLQKLAADYPIDTSPTLNPLGSLYGSQKVESVSIGKSATERPDSFQNFTLPTIIPLKEGIEAHKAKNYQKAWSCFNENVKFNSSAAKYWMGHYLLKGLPDGKKDPVQANLLLKEAADDGIAEAQLHYAFSLFNTPGIKFNRKVFVSYLTKAANGGNIAAQYNLGDIYFNGKILGIKDVEFGTKYLKLAALNNNPRSIKILKDNGIDF
ncbi:hypothetical protein Glove_86g156 [Diversispora epigaea]|uniref:Protein kinase domain-containing protein n=1 Tax=Diversispora epigaea TaxID=1348612 RepID=A0A397JGB1_9GLOM|nr:hypothetical protein Glove_86g156 [Diversispora epigaea]